MIEATGESWTPARSMNKRAARTAIFVLVLQPTRFHDSDFKGNNPGNQNLAVWFCVRPGPTPFFAFGTPARFRVTGAASCGHYAAGAAGKKKLSPNHH